MLDFAAADISGITPQTNVLRVEAESLALSGYRVENSSIASGGALLSLKGSSSNEIGTAFYTFNGPTGTYNLSAGYIDENDGTAHMDVLIGTNKIDSWVWDKNLYAPTDARSRETRIVGTNVMLNPGDVIKFVGRENLGEHARLDYFDIAPTEPGSGVPLPPPDPIPSAGLFRLALLDTQGNIVNGDLSKVTEIAAGNYSIAAIVANSHPLGQEVESVKFGSSLNTQVENNAPFVLFGDNNYRNFTAGAFELTAAAYSGDKGAGEMLASQKISFTVVGDSGSGTPPPTTLPPTAFNPSKDFISLHYDHAPALDDGHSAAADLSVLHSLFGTDWIKNHALPVSGAYGQNASKFNPGSDVVMNAVWNPFGGWISLHDDRAGGLTTMTREWADTLRNGGDVWVKEGGQSDRTADVVQALRSQGFDTKNNVHVVQHSYRNENQTTPSDLAYVKANTDYVTIDHGNAAFAKNGGNDAFEQAALNHPIYKDAWKAAFKYQDPNTRLDFSDTIELTYMLGYRDMSFDKFRTTFLK